MTVLRSRKILPKPSPPLTPENVVTEPATPSRTSEFLNQLSNSTTPSSSSPALNCGHLEIGLGSEDGSVMVSECGIVRRVSARLAKKVGISNYLENVEVVSAKRKKAEGISSNAEFDVRSPGRQVSDLKLGVASSGEIPEPVIVQQILHDMGDGGVTEFVEEGETTKNDIEISTVETVSLGRRKRRFRMEVKVHAEDEVKGGFLSLRSGKRVVKRGMGDEIGCAGNLLEEIENTKESSVVLSGDVLLESMPEANLEEDQNGHCKGRTFRRGEKGKGKGKVGSGTSIKIGSAAAKFELQDRIRLSLDDVNQGATSFTEVTKSEEVVENKDDIVIETGVNTRTRLGAKAKGKMKLGVEAFSCSGINALELNVENVNGGRVSGVDHLAPNEALRERVKASSSSGINAAELKLENVNGSRVSGADHSATNEALPDGVQVRDANVNLDDTRTVYRDRFRKIARRNASRFAHFSSEDELGNHAHDVARREIPLPESDSGIEDWPGPFTTALKIIEDRESSRNGGRRGVSTDVSEAVELKWIPRNQESCKHQKQVPLLLELCLSVLSKNADAVTSLDFVPDALRHKISWFLCGGRRMDGHFLELLVHGTPTEIRMQDCSWLSEELFTKTFESCNASKLTVLQFDQCGRCMPDYALHAALARSPNSLPSLTTISLKGAYRLSDVGLRMLVSAAPSLKSIDISQCPLLTSEGICCLASSLRLVLRELYLDNCHGIDAMLILPALQKLEKLEVLSVAGIQTVCDDFVSEFVSSHGCRMKELVLADCMELTDSSLEVIGDTCSDLRAIDLTNLCKLTDISIGHLANSCRAIQTLKFCRNAFRDEAIAAYLDVRGASLKDLALNNIIQVSNHTALSLARNCRNLRSLDLSWCRNLTNEALGLIVDSCSLLEVLKLFGCTQVTDVFLNGHSNPQVKLIGLKMTPVSKDIDAPDFLLGPLRY